MTITVKLADGTTHDVEPSALTLPDGASLLAPGATPEGFVSKEFHAAEVQRRSKDTAAVRRDLKADPAFVAEVAQSLGIEVRDGKPVVPDADQIKATLREALLRDEVEPLKTQLDSLTNGLRSRTVTASLAGLKDANGNPLIEERFLKPGPNGAPSYAEMAFGPLVKIDPATGAAMAVDGAGNPVPSADKSRAYAEPGEHFASLLRSDEYAHLRPPDAPAQGGAGYRGGGGGNAKTTTRAAFDGMPPAAQAAFVKDGGTVTD